MFHKLMNNHHQVPAAQLVTQYQGSHKRSLPLRVLLRRERKWKMVFAESTGSQAKFHNISVEDIIIIEICAGSARLTKAARAMGFKGVAVDHSDKRSCGVDICIFDLTDPLQLQDLLEYIRKDASRIALIWVAPSCGTASRARERPIPGQKSCPKPLRSTSQPDGLDGLTGLDKYKVEMANQLYDAVFHITECAVELDICVAIENPTNSHYWNVESTTKIRTNFGGKLCHISCLRSRWHS